jgi:hypothetical protein
VSENSFGILAQKFIIFLRTIKSSPENVDNIISAACVLHDFIRQRNDESANKTNTITDEPSGTAQVLNSLPLQGGEQQILPSQFEKFLKITSLHQLVGSYLQIITCKLI